MFRSLVLFIFSLVAIVILLLLVLFGVLRWKIFNADLYTTALAETAAYEQMRTVLLDSIPQELDAAQPDERINLFQEVGYNMLEQFITTDRIQTLIDNNINNVFAYLRGNDEKLMVFLSVSDLRGAITDGEIRQLLQDTLDTKINSLPPCTPSQEALFQNQKIDFADFPSCRPQAIGTPQLEQIATSEQLTELEQKVTSENEFFSWPDNQSIDELVLKIENTDVDPDDIYQGLNLGRDIYQRGGMILLGGAGFLALLFLLTWLISGRQNSRWLKWTGFVFLVVGLLLIVGNILGTKLGEQFLDDTRTNALTEIAAEQNTEESLNIAKDELVTLGFDLGETIARNLLQAYLIVSVVLAVFGALLMSVGIIITPSKPEVLKNQVH